MSSLQLLKLSEDRYINVDEISQIDYNEKTSWVPHGKMNIELTEKVYHLTMKNGRTINVSNQNDDKPFKKITKLTKH